MELKKKQKGAHGERPLVMVGLQSESEVRADAKFLKVSKHSKTFGEVWTQTLGEANCCLMLPLAAALSDCSSRHSAKGCTSVCVCVCTCTDSSENVKTKPSQCTSN